MQRRTLLSLPAWPLAAGCASSTLPDTEHGTEPGTVLTQVDTALGSFTIAVNMARAPITVANYLAHVDAGLLDGGAVYRIVRPENQGPETRHKIEVVQWGMNLGSERKPPRPPIAHETTATTGLRHLDGTVSMARLAPGSATAEFFICIGAQPELDFGGRRNPDGQGFAAFGQVVAGREVVQALYARGLADTQYPKPPVAVLRVRRVAAPRA